jgi:hypothetical protein
MSAIVIPRLLRGFGSLRDNRFHRRERSGQLFLRYQSHFFCDPERNAHFFQKLQAFAVQMFSKNRRNLSLR